MTESIKKPITIKDIAREAGVSPSLVSFALNNTIGENGQKRYKVNDGTARRILEIAKKYNYVQNNAARALRSRKSRAIGVILTDISNNFFSSIARHIEDEAYAVGYSVLFASTDEKVEKMERAVAVLLSKGVDGLIIVPCADCEPILEAVMARNIPVVLLDRDVESVSTNRVVLDNELAGRQAVKALYEGGFRRIVMISYAMKVSNIAHREAGYRAEMERLGLGDYVKVYSIDYDNVNRSMEECVASIDFTETDALLFATNTLSVAGVKAIHRKGLSMPDEVGVVAFDGSDAFDLCTVPVAYIKQPVEQFAHEALQRVVRKIAHPETELSTLVLMPTFIDGESAHCTK